MAKAYQQSTQPAKHALASGLISGLSKKGAKKRKFCGAGLQARDYVMSPAVTMGGIAIPNRKEP